MLDLQPKTEGTHEVPFEFDEIFFSRTTDSGIILSGNSVFQRVSGYSWDELINKPHKIIRHPDMPKAVFWLLWDTIKQGKPIGAYVKNRAKDGRHYWVYAIVTPIDEGYLSVRVKPSGSIFEIVEKEYKALRALELRDNLKSEKSAAMLLARLQELGFRDYGAFMSTALSEVIAERDDQLRQSEDFSIARFNRLRASAQKLLDHASSISRIYEGNEYVSLNMRIQAAQLGDLGAPLSVISNNYTTVSKQIQTAMKRFLEEGNRVALTIDEGLFLVGTSRIQSEVYEFFKEDTDKDDEVSAFDMKQLERQRQSFSKKATEGLTTISSQIIRFQEAYLEMKQLILGLEVTRVMGKIESASIDASLTNLNNLIDDLGQFQQGILNELKQIDMATRSIKRDIEQLLER